jgi:FkbM family methyltransferase
VFLRRLVPPLDLTLSIGAGLRIRANLRTHLGLFRPGFLAREIATASAMLSHIPPDRPAYDVGANIGLYTLVFAANRVRPVVSIEPSPLALPYLHGNIARNSLATVRVCPMALSDRVGSVRFALDSTTTCTSHVSAPDEPGVLVPCSDLDTLVAADRLPPPRLVKLDVEGHDEPILRGMRRILAEVRPVVCLEGALRRADGKLVAIELLEAAGYSVWDLAGRQRLSSDTEAYVIVGIPD